MNPITHPIPQHAPPWPPSLSGIPIIYEDEDEEDMGEASIHYWAIHVTFTCLTAFLKDEHADLHAFANLNCYYAPGPRDPKSGSLPYFSADVMIVRPSVPKPWDFASYTIGDEGPVPEVVIEVLSLRTAQTRDLSDKLEIYSKLGIKEYILVDPIALFLPERLVLKTLQPDGKWKDLANEDGSVTSALGFRLLFDADGVLAVFHAGTGERYLRADEAQAEARRRQQAEERAWVEAEARREAVERARAEAEARREAEERARAEAEAHRLTQARIEALEEELRRLRRDPS